MRPLQAWSRPGVGAVSPALPFGVLGVWLLLTCLGCQPAERLIESTVQYDPPGTHDVQGVVVVDSGFEEIWAELTQRAAQEPYQILASNKQAHFAVVGFRASETDLSPTRFVDCGRLERVVTEGDRSEEFEFELAESSRDRRVEVVDDGYEIRDVDRSVGLEIRTTLFLKPEGDQRTRVTANTRYTVIIEESGISRVVPRQKASDPSPAKEFGPDRVEIPFTSFADGELPGDAGMRCRPTGEIERRMLALTAPAA